MTMQGIDVDLSNIIETLNQIANENGILYKFDADLGYLKSKEHGKFYLYVKINHTFNLDVFYNLTSFTEKDKNEGKNFYHISVDCSNIFIPIHCIESSRFGTQPSALLHIIILSLDENPYIVSNLKTIFDCYKARNHGADDVINVDKIINNIEQLAFAKKLFDILFASKNSKIAPEEKLRQIFDCVKNYADSCENFFSDKFQQDKRDQVLNCLSFHIFSFCTDEEKNNEDFNQLYKNNKNFGGNVIYVILCIIKAGYTYNQYLNSYKKDDPNTAIHDVNLKQPVTLNQSDVCMS